MQRTDGEVPPIYSKDDRSVVTGESSKLGDFKLHGWASPNRGELSH